MNSPSYYGNLPAEVRYSKELKPMEKILYTELTALSNKYGYCIAKNSYFASLYEVHKDTAGKWINNLEKQGFIRTQLIYKEGTKQILQRRIYISRTPIDENIDTYRQEDREGIDEKCDTPIDENIEDINITREEYYKSNIKKEIIKEKEKKPLRKAMGYEALSQSKKDELYKHALLKDCAYYLEAFIDYHISKGSTFLDWERAYNTWLRNQENFDRDNWVDRSPKLIIAQVEAPDGSYKRIEAYDCGEGILISKEDNELLNLKPVEEPRFNLEEINNPSLQAQTQSKIQNLAKQRRME